MKNIYKKSFLILILSAPAFIFSCINTEEEPERTAAIEQQEIDSTISRLEAKGYDVDTTALGSYYILGKTGTGAFPQSGDTVKLIYTAFFLNGTIFDASYFYYTDSLFQVVFMKDPMITGFNEAISLLNTGAVADFIIPSELAYGPDGYQGVEPYTPLGFNIKMKEIKPKN